MKTIKELNQKFEQCFDLDSIPKMKERAKNLATCAAVANVAQTAKILVELSQNSGLAVATIAAADDKTADIITAGLAAMASGSIPVLLGIEAPDSLAIKNKKNALIKLAVNINNAA